MTNVRRLLLPALSVAGLLLSSDAGASSISYPTFSSSAGLTLNGSATVTSGVLRLTSGGTQAGTAWVTALQDVALGFDTTFQFMLAPLSSFSGQPSGDGFTFMIQNAGLSALGPPGEWLAYNGIPNSVAIEFDTFCNNSVAGCYETGSLIADPSGNHLSVHTRGTLPNDVRETFSLGSTTLIPTLDDGAIHTARIVYVPNLLTIYLDDLTTPRLTVALDLATILNLNNGRAYLGFTGSGAAAAARQDILNWSSTSPSVASETVPEPASLLLLGSGLAAVALRRYRRRPR